MKKWLLALLSALMIVALVGCGETETKGTEAETKGTESVAPSSTEVESSKAESAGTFRVGYARTDVTPKDSVPLAGYGNTLKRMSDGFLDYTYTTCVAIIDENDDILLMYTTDVIQSGDHHKLIKARLGESLGIPEDHIIVTATHTHSNIDQGQKQLTAVSQWISFLVDSMEEVAKEAIADASEATMRWTTVDLLNYNSTRHYFSENGMAVGDNHNSGDSWGAGKLIKHTTEANHIMYMLEFCRAAEDKKDILLTNWRAHPTKTGGSSVLNISSDFVGAIRSNIEKSEGILFAYFQGEAGNQNPKTRLNEDQEMVPTTDNKQYGKEVAALISEAMHGEWKEVKTGPIYTIHEIYKCDGNHSRLELSDQARQIVAIWKEGGWTDTVTKMLQAAGLYSPYECSAIIGRAASGTVDKSIHATVIGEFCFVNLQAEQFDTNGTWIKENAPSEFTMVMAYTDGNGYVPSQFAYEYGCYEADTTVCAPGSGEVLAARELELLNQMWEKAGNK